MTKAQAGQLGGLSTFKKHGIEHMKRIGKNGANVTWSRYKLVPYQQAQYAMINKTTGKLIAIIGG